jgi:hypothetical protein
LGHHRIQAEIRSHASNMPAVAYIYPP